MNKSAIQMDPFATLSPGNSKKGKKQNWHLYSTDYKLRSPPNNHPKSKPCINILNKSMFSLRKHMQQLAQEQQKQVQSRRYRKASLTQQKMQKYQRQYQQLEFQKMTQEHLRQQQLLLSVHKKEMKHFKCVWKDFREQSRQKQRILFKRFQQTHQQNKRQASINLYRKVNKINQSKHKSLIQIEKKQVILIRAHKYLQLHNLMLQKKKIRNRLKKQRSTLIQHYKHIEQLNLRNKAHKRYNSLLQRLDDVHNDEYTTYRNQKYKLQQKYKNILSSLKHQQVMELHQQHRMYQRSS